MERKSIFNTLAFWRVLITLLSVAIIIGFSCGLIFYTKIFEKWDRTKVIAIDEYDGYTAKVIYIVDGQEYRNQIKSPFDRSAGTWLHKAVVGNIDLYVDYLVSNPNYFLPHNTKRDTTIIFSILWVASVGISTVILVKIYKKQNGEKNKKQYS
jgi:hypothetical protein